MNANREKNQSFLKLHIENSISNQTSTLLLLPLPLYKSVFQWGLFMMRNRKYVEFIVSDRMKEKKI